ELGIARSDAMLIALAAVHGVVLLAAPSAAVIAAGLWWNANTVAHNFVHRPFFRSRAANRVFGAYLTVLLGFPQALWRQRHLAHHAGSPHRVHLSIELEAQTILILSLWRLLAGAAPHFFLTVYLPGY